MKAVTGDLLNLAEAGMFDVIIHGCNCLCNMGSGIAKTVKNRYPQAFKADCETVKGDREKLGDYTYSLVGKNKDIILINAYTQYSYSRDKVDVDYDAVRNVFSKIKRDYSKKKIGYPLIGAGLAGGDWEIIEAIINEELDGEDHTLVRFEPDIKI